MSLGITATERLLAGLEGERPVELGAREVLALAEAMEALSVFLARLPARRRADWPYSERTIRAVERRLLEAWPELRPVVRPAAPEELRRYRRR